MTPNLNTARPHLRQRWAWAVGGGTRIAVCQVLRNTLSPCCRMAALAVSRQTLFAGPSLFLSRLWPRGQPQIRNSGPAVDLITCRPVDLSGGSP